MVAGGVSVNKRTARIIRLAGFILPLFAAGYGILLHYGAVDQSNYAGLDTLLLITAPWLSIASLQFFVHPRTQRDAALMIIGHHIFAGLYLLLAAGFNSSFIAAWTILFLASYVYFSTRGLHLSIAFLLLIASTNLILLGGEPGAMAVTIITVIAVLAVGVAGTSINRAQEIDSAELERSKAEESLQRDRIITIVNNLSDAVLSVDRDGVIRVYNAASLNLLDTNTSLNGSHLNEVVTLYDMDEKPLDLFSELKKSRAAVIRDDLTYIIGEEKLRLEVTFSPIRGSYSKSKRASSRDGYIIIMRDVTKAKSLEEERDEFISVVSHELRTPITVAEGTLSNVQLMMKKTDIAAKILEDNVTTAHEQIVFLAKMVNDLSTLSRAERGVADEPELIDVRELVNDLYHEYAPQAEKKQLHFNLDLSTHLGSVYASRLYLKELLQNFITNSIKYTKEGSVSLSVTNRDGKVQFSVKDTGIGISKSDQSKIFNKFYRSEDYRTRETGGTGLGLYVAVKLSKKLGTSIDLSSRLNHGSTFSFSLPEETSRNK